MGISSDNFFVDAAVRRVQRCFGNLLQKKMRNAPARVPLIENSIGLFSGKDKNDKNYVPRFTPFAELTGASRQRANTGVGSTRTSKRKCATTRLYAYRIFSRYK